MFTSLELKIRVFTNKLLNLVIRFILLLPLSTSTKNKLTAKIKKTQKKIRINLFDDEKTLTYVKMKETGLAKKASSITTIALRGSNADYGFYAPMWQNSYNLGLTSSDFYSNYHIYENYKNKLKNLQNIIVFLSVPAPGYSLIHTSERYRAVAYKFFFGIPYSKSKQIKNRFEKRIIKKCSRLTIEESVDDYVGYDKKTYYGTDIPASERIKTHLRENGREPSQLEWLKKLSDSINKDSRKLILVITPYRSDYKKLLPTKEVLFKKFHDLNLNNVDFLDYYDSNLFTDEDMGDTDHMNEQGAIKLTAEIKKYFMEKGYM